MADNVIDSLSIQIDSDIKGASKGIEELKKTLNSLNDIYNKAKEASGNVHEKLRDLASGMNAIANINSDGLKSATAAMRGFLKLDFGSMSAIPAGVADNIVSIADGVNLFAMQIDGKELNKSMSALKKLREFDFQGLSMNVDNLDPSIAQKVRTFMDSFKSVSGDFTVSDTLASMQSLFQIDFSGFANFMAEASKGMPNFAAAIQQFSAACATPEFDSAIEKLQRLANVDLSGLAQLAVSGKKLVPDVSKQVDSETAEVKSSVDKMKSVLDFSGIFKRAVGGVKMVAAIPFNSLKKGFASVRASAEKAANKVSGFIRSFGRIAFYRSIRFLFSQIAKGFKEGTDNLYQYSKAIDGKFAKSMDMIATSMLYFRNSVAAAAAPIINYLAPALDVLVDKAVEVLNWFNELTAKLTGASTWTKALKYPKEYAEATKDASKALKDFQMGFDELNVISDNSSSSAADVLDYSKMFTEMKVDVDFEPWADAFRKAIENSEFFEAGQILGKKFNDAIDQIDSKLLADKLAGIINNAVHFALGFLTVANFTNLGTKVGDFINESFAKIDFYGIGAMLGMSINKVFDFAIGFVKTLDFEKIGLRLADGFNGLVDYINVDNIVIAINNSLDGILTTLDTFLSNIQAYGLGAKVGDALTKFDGIGLLIKFTGVLNQFLIDVFDFLSGLIDRTDFGSLGITVAEEVFNYDNVEDSKVNELGQAFAKFAGKAIGSGMNFIWGYASASFAKFVEKTKKNFEIAGVLGATAFLLGCINPFGNIEKWIKDNIVDPFVDALCEKLGMSKNGGVSTVMKKIGQNTIAGFKNGMLNPNFSLADIVAGLIGDKVIAKAKERLGIASPSKVFTEIGENTVIGLKNGITNKWNEVSELVSNKLDEMKSNFDNFSLSDFVDKFSRMKDDIINTFNDIPIKLQSSANRIWDMSDGIVNGVIESFNALGDRLRDFKFNVPVVEAGKVFEIIVDRISSVQIGRYPGYENGGYPKSADFFYANENGVAEMVGRIGNRTAVANNDQIVEAVAQGVAQAVAEVLGSRSDNSNQNINIYLDGKQITASVEKYQRTRGVSIYGGGFVNA